VSGRLLVSAAEATKEVERASMRDKGRRPKPETRKKAEGRNPNFRRDEFDESLVR
jgi:hypothetical protein